MVFPFLCVSIFCRGICPEFLNFNEYFYIRGLCVWHAEKYGLSMLELFYMVDMIYWYAGGTGDIMFSLQVAVIVFEPTCWYKVQEPLGPKLSLRLKSKSL